jgi:hypothetical protein
MDNEKKNREEIPCFIYWEVWKQRNLIIFENFIPNFFRVYTCILRDLRDFKAVEVYKKRRIDRPPILDWDLAVEFFDGASQEMGKKCGAGTVLKCRVLDTFRIKMNCGSQTNTKGELLA